MSQVDTHPHRCKHELAPQFLFLLVRPQLSEYRRPRRLDILKGVFDVDDVYFKASEG